MYQLAAEPTDHGWLPHLLENCQACLASNREIDISHNLDTHSAQYYRYHLSIDKPPMTYGSCYKAR